MSDDGLLGSLPLLSFAFVLVLSRCGMVVALMPGLGEADAPALVRAGLTMALSLLLLPSVLPLLSKEPDGFGWAAAIAGEVAVGGILGWLARLPVIALSTTGTMISYLTGLTSVVQNDPALGGQSAALGRLMGLVAPVLVLSTGLYQLPLEALAGSYNVIPPGVAIPADSAIDLIKDAMSASFGLAVQLSAPFILASLVLQIGLGLLARLVPQLQVFSASTPGQILGGMLLLGALAAPLLTTWSTTVNSAWAALPGL